VRAFTDEQVEQLVRDAEDEQARRIPLELRRLYAAEDAAQNNAPALFALLTATHQQMHAAARTLEGAMRLIAPPQSTPTAPLQEPPKKRPRVLGDQPE
jgi:hypothetical protein